MDDNDPLTTSQTGPIRLARVREPSGSFEAMAFSRRKEQEPKERRGGRDPFAHLQDEREQAEEEPWFLAPDEGPELHVETGISSNLSEDDLKTK
jgi:hypothetical protein